MDGLLVGQEMFCTIIKLLSNLDITMAAWLYIFNKAKDREYTKIRKRRLLMTD